MKVAVVSGSHRLKSQSGKIGRFVVAHLKGLGHEGDLIDLAHDSLPFWDEGMWSGEPKITGQWKPFSDRLKSCDAAVFVAPEWGGMVPSMLKNFFLFASDGSLYHKPGLLVGVSSSRNGAYPIAELRLSSYKNSHIQYISEHVIIRNAEKVLNTETPEGEEDTFVRTRLDYGLRVLVEYGKALKQVRESGVLDRKNFAFGM